MVRVSPEAELIAPFPIPVLGRDVVYETDPATGWIAWYECARSYWGTSAPAPPPPPFLPSPPFPPNPV